MSRRVIEISRKGRVGSDGQSNLVGVETVSVSSAVTNDDSGKAYRGTADLTLTLPAATTSGWSLIVDADGGDVTLAAPMLVNGLGSVVVLDGNSIFIFSDGATMYGRYYFGNALSGANLTALGALSSVANLSSLADLTLAPNKGLYATAANTLALFDLSAFGRVLGGAADASGALTALTIPKSDNVDWTVDTGSISDRGAIKAYVDGQALGVGQTWTNQTGSRALDTLYTNTTGRTIKVRVIAVYSDDGIALQVAGSTVCAVESPSGSGVWTLTVDAEVPNGATYQAVTSAGNPSLTAWWELV